jgi:hypothetical protein
MRPLLLCALLTCGCLSAWSPSGPWACSDTGTCAAGLTCDDGVCCTPGGTPRCPTLPVDGRCSSGNAPAIFYRDLDGDGAGDPATGRPFCTAPIKERWVATGNDCDDTDVTISPTATERCNGVDDDCDRVIDNGLKQYTWYPDVDGDSYGADCDAGRCLQACAAPKGYVARAGDCAPEDPARYPGAPEKCNGVDDNCNGLLDDPPFADVENPGAEGGPRFDCVASGLEGLCAAGGLQCLFDPVSSKFQPTCVPRLAPAPEVCGDGLDNDCDGLVDNQPGCGGPASLLGTPATTVLALRLSLPDAGTPSGLPARCLAADVGARPMGWLNPSWVGSGGVDRHLWALQAPAGLPWDLSSPTSSLRLALSLPFWINPAPGGWGGPSWFPNPEITLCGPKGQYVRYFPLASTFDTAIQSGFALSLPLWAPKAGWQVENSPIALDRRQVTSLEIVVSAQQPATGTVTFTLVFSPDGGFSK